MVIPVSRSTLFVVFPSAFSSISFRLLRSLPEVSVVVDGIVPRVPFLAVAASRLQEDVVDELLPVAFRVEPIACPAFQVEQIFGHVFVQIVFRRGLLFIVPVGIFVHLDWLAVSERARISSTLSRLPCSSVTQALFVGSIQSHLPRVDE